MKQQVRHVLGISGGKDSAALAIYMHRLYPHLDIEYYCCDTGKELDETYKLIDNLEAYLGKKITRLLAAEGSHHEAPFDHFIEQYGGYIPSSNARWCTKKLKLEPFETFVGTDPVISYVGIRGDEDREGYISKKSNIQSIFPFRKNLWSEDVVSKLLANNHIVHLGELYARQSLGALDARVQEIVARPLSITYQQDRKLRELLEVDTAAFNRVVFAYLQGTNYPLAGELDFPMLDNTDVLVRDDIFRILRESGVGVPGYYEEIGFEVNGKKGTYARSRSGCFFCFYQQKIEWVWLLEQHPELFAKAMDYEKDGYKWMDNETLVELMQPARVATIKEEFLKRTGKAVVGSAKLMDFLLEGEDLGCVSCFV
jgi:3'-phosphoadenosine 5'-phosphosulfate sulfotransferase (PAPS reductase)/FAD synthetase